MVEELGRCKLKIDRRAREYKSIIVGLCTKFGLILPTKVELMRNYVGKREKSFGTYMSRHNTDGYKISIRVKKLEGDKLVKRPKEEVTQSICHELAHSVYHEHSPQHNALTEQMVVYAKNSLI